MENESELPGTVSLDLASTPDLALAAGVRGIELSPGPRAIISWLTVPWVDKVLAILAVLPFVYPIGMHLKQHLRLGELIYLAEVLLLIGTMVSRRIPKRVALNPFYTALACVASYWGLYLLSVKQPGRVVVPPLLILPIYLCSVFIVFLGRISLGRNIGMIPAQRELVDRGAYRWMRHPIYTAYFFSMIAGTLDSYSPKNLFLYSFGILLFVIRSLTEEEFLRKDPQYTAYMKRVPWRWFPGLF